MRTFDEALARARDAYHLGRSGVVLTKLTVLAFTRCDLAAFHLGAYHAYHADRRAR